MRSIPLYWSSWFRCWRGKRIIEACNWCRKTSEKGYQESSSHSNCAGWCWARVSDSTWISSKTPYTTWMICWMSGSLLGSNCCKDREFMMSVLLLPRSRYVRSFSPLALVSNKSFRVGIHSTALINISDTRGWYEEKTVLKSKLLCDNSQQQNAIHIISPVRMGGIDKTILAQFAYNDNDM